MAPPAPLPSSGIYTIRILEDGDPGVEDYTLTLLRLEGSASCDIVATPLHCGETVESSISGGFRFQSFQAEAGDVARFASGFASGWHEIFAPDGTSLLYGISTPLPETGRYLVMTTSDATTPVPYRYTLEAISASFNGGSNGPPTPVCGVADGTKAIGCGETVSGTVVASGTDTYTFFGAAGDEVSVSVTGTVVTDLYAPSGEPLWDSSLPESGVYTLRVARQGAGVVSYTATLNRTPCHSACNDGADNDADGRTDFPAEPGCTSPEDFSEAPECGDGLDNDGDDAIDALDAGCVSAFAASEDPACDDGQDNDGDGAFDFDGAGSGSEDAYCMAASAGFEAAPPGCGIGPELILLPALLGPLVTRRARRGTHPRRP